MKHLRRAVELYKPLEHKLGIFHANDRHELLKLIATEFEVDAAEIELLKYQVEHLHLRILELERKLAIAKQTLVAVRSDEFIGCDCGYTDEDQSLHELWHLCAKHRAAETLKQIDWHNV